MSLRKNPQGLGLYEEKERVSFRELSAAEALGFELIVTLENIKAYLEVSDAAPDIKRAMEKKIRGSFIVYHEYAAKGCACGGRSGVGAVSESAQIFDA